MIRRYVESFHGRVETRHFRKIAATSPSITRLVRRGVRGDARSHRCLVLPLPNIDAPLLSYLTEIREINE